LPGSSDWLSLGCGSGGINMNSREITSYLKAVAILSVCLNHFVNEYISDSFKGYGNGFLSIFFILSGFGIHSSLAKLAKEKSVLGSLSSFFKKRIIRVYPLYWIWSILNGFPGAILGFFALNFVDPQFLWFIPAILQCYIIAPVLFFLYERLHFFYHIVLVTFLFALANFVLFAGDYYPAPALGYRGMFFLHISQFCLGFYLVKIVKENLFNKYYAFFSVIFFLIFINETTPQELFVFSGKEYLFPLLLSFSAFFLCLVFLSIDIDLPFKKTLIFVGTYTYSIYIYHTYSFSILEKLGVLGDTVSIWHGMFFWILTFPLFVFFFAFIEALVNEFVLGKRRLNGALNAFLKAMSINQSLIPIKGK
jgi:peptidoglycan/LPS O-acetylase OafA/YrhL